MQQHDSGAGFSVFIDVTNMAAPPIFSVAPESGGGGSNWHRNSHLSVFSTSAERFPSKVAVFDAERSLSYQALFECVMQLANQLRAAEVAKNTAVAVCLERSANWVVALLAIWEAGGCYVPLDAALPTARIRYMLDTSAATIAIVDNATIGKLKGLATLVNVKRPGGESSPVLASATTPFASDASQRDRAYVIFTSGTTGHPKGVQIDHGNVANMALEHVRSGEIKCSDRVALCASFGFDASIRDIVGALATGATLYVTSAEELELSAFCPMLIERQITYAVVTPALLGAVGDPPQMPDLKTLVVAGEAPSRRLIRAWGGGRLLINAYGPTEATVCATKQLYPDGFIAPDQPVSIGRPTHGVIVQVLDEQQSAVPEGGLGELYIGGASVSRLGYIGNATLNAQRFVDLPGLGHTYRTGDICRLLAGGKLEWVERADDQIKINGYRIESAEVRAAIADIPEVTDCVIRPWRNAARTYLIAYLVMPQMPERATPGSVARYIKEAIRHRLPAYSIPSFILKVDELPRTANGKIDIARLPLPELDEACAPPHGCDATEAALWSVWFDVLPRAVAVDFTIDTEFRDGGGSSIEAQLILHRIALSWRQRIPYRRFLDGGGTIRWVARLLKMGEDAGLVTCPEEAPESGDLSIYLKTATPCLRIHRAEDPVDSGRLRCLLTGATGFLGAHLLASLTRCGVDVACLVRADAGQQGDARIRLQHALDEYGIPLGVQGSDIEVIVGDIRRENLGMTSDSYRELSRAMDVVFHCAADVDFTKNYQQLAPSNVHGTAQVLKFAAAERMKKFNYISTLAVFFSEHAAASYCDEASSEAHGRGVLGGYAQSKWVSEQIVRCAKEQGLDVSVFRPARLWGDAQRLQYRDQDLYVRLLKFIALSRKAPDIDYSMDFTMVGNAADAIAQLAMKAPADYYHILDARTAHIRDIVRWINESGLAVELLSYDRWLQLLGTELAARILGPLVSVFIEPINRHGSLFDNLVRLPRYMTGIFPNDKTRRALGDPDPLFGAETVKTYLDRCLQLWLGQEEGPGAARLGRT